MQSRQWKAFVRLSGETVVDGDRDIIKDFTGFAKQLESIGVEYSIVVRVDRGPLRQYSAKISRFQTIVPDAATARRQARQEGD